MWPGWQSLPISSWMARTRTGEVQTPELKPQATGPLSTISSSCARGPLQALRGDGLP